MRTSKYLGKEFNGWKVVDVIPTAGRHYIYTLKRKKGFTIQTMTVRDNELTKFANGKTVDAEISGKNLAVSKNIRKYANVIITQKSFKNLFRAI